MTERKTFYRKRLVPDEAGLLVVTERWVSIHETPCFHYCVTDWSLDLMLRVGGPGGLLATARRRRQLKRIHKEGSRFAFETEEQALDHLRFLKRRQLRHLEREQKMVEAFLEAEKLKSTGGDGDLIPGTEDLVHSYYVFD